MGKKVWYNASSFSVQESTQFLGWLLIGINEASWTEAHAFKFMLLYHSACQQWFIAQTWFEQPCDTGENCYKLRYMCNNDILSKLIVINGETLHCNSFVAVIPLTGSVIAASIC